MVRPGGGSPRGRRPGRGDRASRGGERGAVVEARGPAIDLDAQLAPQRVQVDGHGLVLHPPVELGEHGHAGSPVADVEQRFERRRRLHVAGGEDRAQRLLEARAVLRAPVDLDVGYEREECAAPVRAAPRRRVIEAAVAGLGEALRQSRCQLGPDRLGSELPRLCAGHRLHVGGEPFLDPVMPGRDRGKGQMRELVDQDPVSDEVGGGGLRPDDDADRSPAIAPRPPAAHAAARPRYHEEPRALGGKAPVVSGHRARRLLDPREQRGARQVERARRDGDRDLAAGHRQPFRGQSFERGKGHALAEVDRGRILGTAGRGDEDQEQRQ